MNPERAAVEIRGELEAALEDWGGTAEPARVRSVEAPPDLGSDRYFRVTLSASAAHDQVVKLPAALAMGYLADEEAAVDEFKLWVAELWERLAR